ncbi:MAG: DEAD/DEAH box helicase [Propionibacteriaceae bacterium]|nr:DEAD/DEAH box helicase [Propionibacteriaceae bacterium]
MSEARPRDLRVMRGWEREARRLRRLVVAAIQATTTAKEAIVDCYRNVLADLCRSHIEALDLSTLRDASQGRLNLAALRKNGYTKVGQIMYLTDHQLVSLPGVGAHSARSIQAACEALWGSIAKETSFRIALDPSDTHATALLQSLNRYNDIRSVSSQWWTHMADLVSKLTAELEITRVLPPVRWLFTSPHRRVEAEAAMFRIRAILDEPSSKQVESCAQQVVNLAAQTPANPWPSFEQRASDYYALLGEFVQTSAPEDALQGYVTDDIVAQVNSLELDKSLLRVDLRGYQGFGAKYALVQRRVIIGDEMGLGKTIQALAGMCHRRAVVQGASPQGRVLPMLVVCPASVMANWGREIETRTTLDMVEIHGSDRQDEVNEWLDKRCVGVTTFDTLKGLQLPSDLHLEVLVVDEAHYAKNPGTGRSRLVKHMCDKANYVWFLSGTPMENRVQEFITLASFLQSDVLPRDSIPTTATAFRQAVAPVYLRRNASDVLAELPERIDQDEWVTFTAEDQRNYVQAVDSGNLMAMRQAGYEATNSAKLERFVELVQEAADNGLKVVAYSFFLGTLQRAHDSSPVRSFGPLTGEMSPKKRLDILDEFTAYPAPALLLGQIKVGGVGLNIQAASVVILMEPQYTPTSEDQAIARSHRMGQVRPTQVYRLLAENSVDQSLVELLESKRSEFDQYVRPSDIAQKAGQAIDVSFQSLSRHLVAIEQGRELR